MGDLVRVTHPDPSAEPAIWTPSGTAGRVSQHSPRNTWCSRLPVEVRASPQSDEPQSCGIQMFNSRLAHLPGQIKHVCVSIIEGEEDSGQTVDLLLCDGSAQILLQVSTHVWRSLMTYSCLENSLQPTWSHNAICLVFHLETPVVRTSFRLPRNTTRFTRELLQSASCSDEHRVKQAGSVQI